MNIQTSYVHPPIPARDADWSAVDQDTYDGAEDSNCPIGRGATEREAINDLVEQLVERAEENSEVAKLAAAADAARVKIIDVIANVPLVECRHVVAGLTRIEGELRAALAKISGWIDREIERSA